MKAIVSGGFYGSGICVHTEIASHDMKIALCLQIQTQIYQSACWQLVPSHGGVVMSLLTAIPRNNPTSTFFFGCEFQNRKTNSIFSAHFPLYLTLYHLYHSYLPKFLEWYLFHPNQDPRCNTANLKSGLSLWLITMKYTTVRWLKSSI